MYCCIHSTVHTMYGYCGTHICMVTHIARVWIDRVRLQSCSWPAEQGKLIFLCPRSRLRIWSRGTGSAVPFRVSLLVLHTQAEPGAYLRYFSRFPRCRPFIYTAIHHRASPNSSGHATTHRRRSLPRARQHRASSPQGSSSNGCCLCRPPWTNYCAPPFFHTHFWYEIGLLKVSEAISMQIQYC